MGDVDFSKSGNYQTLGDGSGFIIVTDGTNDYVASSVPITVGQTLTASTTLGNFNPNPPCFARGTLIDGAEGPVPVEDLAIGDRVVTWGGVRPVRWIGRRAYAGRFYRANPHVHPIRIAAGALGGGLPRRDLLVSPKHAMLLDGVLVPAECLVDGHAIAPVRTLDGVEYVHLELDSHDIVFAEGAASETYLDDDNRAMFHNAHTWQAPADAQPPRYCAPRVEHGFALEAIRSRLACIQGAADGAAGAARAVG